MALSCFPFIFLHVGLASHIFYIHFCPLLTPRPHQILFCLFRLERLSSFHQVVLVDSHKEVYWSTEPQGGQNRIRNSRLAARWMTGQTVDMKHTLFVSVCYTCVCKVTHPDDAESFEVVHSGLSLGNATCYDHFLLLFLGFSVKTKTTICCEYPIITESQLILQDIHSLTHSLYSNEWFNNYLY